MQMQQFLLKKIKHRSKVKDALEHESMISLLCHITNS
jgi:hypothetical protein